jgi:hypothetical protein
VVYTLQTLTVDESKVNPHKLKEIEEAYLRLYFRPQNEIDAAITAQLNSILTRSINISDDGLNNKKGNADATINPSSSAYGKNNIHQERENDDDEWQYLREERS